jgi:hypothetical protein
MKKVIVSIITYAKYGLVMDFCDRRKSVLSLLIREEAVVSMQMALLPGA